MLLLRNGGPKPDSGLPQRIYQGGIQLRYRAPWPASRQFRLPQAAQGTTFTGALTKRCVECPPRFVRSCRTVCTLEGKMVSASRRDVLRLSGALVLSAAWYRSAARADRVHGEPTRPGEGAASGAARESPITAWVRISRDG